MRHIHHIIFAAMISLYAFVNVALAQPKLAPPITKGGTTLQEFIELLITIVQAVLMPVVVLCVIYGGFLYVSAGDNEADRTKAKGWVLWSLVGSAIIMGALVIANMIKGTVTSI